MSDHPDPDRPLDCPDLIGDTKPVLTRSEALEFLRNSLGELQEFIYSLSDISVTIGNTILVIDRIRRDLYEDVQVNSPGPQPFDSDMLSRAGVDWDGPDLLHPDHDDHRGKPK